MVDPTANPAAVQQQPTTAQHNAAAAKAKSPNGGKTPTKAKAPAVEILVPNSKAQSVARVGTEILSSISAQSKAESKIESLSSEVRIGKREVLARLTKAVYDISQADDRIDLNAAFSSDVARKNRLNNALRVGLGIMEVKATEGGTQYLAFTKEAAKFMPPTGKKVNKDSAAYKASRSLANNFATQLKHAAQTAASIADMEAKVELTKTGTLQISGPKVEKTIGIDNVTLDGSKGDDLKIERADFGNIRQIAADRRGASSAVVRNRQRATDTRPRQLNLGEITNALITAINQHEGEFSADDQKHLTSARTAIDGALSRSLIKGTAQAS